MTAYTDSAEGARLLVREQAAERISRRLEAGLADDTLALVSDPQVARVWGVLDKASAEIVLIAYCAEGDFERNEEWWER